MIAKGCFFLTFSQVTLIVSDFSDFAFDCIRAGRCFIQWQRFENFSPPRILVHCQVVIETDKTDAKFWSHCHHLLDSYEQAHSGFQRWISVIHSPDFKLK